MLEFQPKQNDSSENHGLRQNHLELRMWVYCCSRTSSLSLQADLFYFKDEEDLYNSAGLKKHGLAVVGMVGTAVANIDDLSVVVPALQALGKRHVKRGILPVHYPVVGQALLNTLEQGLCADYTPEVKAAWEGVYKIIADTMMSDHYSDL